MFYTLSYAGFFSKAVILCSATDPVQTSDRVVVWWRCRASPCGTTLLIWTLWRAVILTSPAFLLPILLDFLPAYFVTYLADPSIWLSISYLPHCLQHFIFSLPLSGLSCLFIFQYVDQSLLLLNQTRFSLVSWEETLVSILPHSSFFFYLLWLDATVSLLCISVPNIHRFVLDWFVLVWLQIGNLWTTGQLDTNWPKVNGGNQRGGACYQGDVSWQFSEWSSLIIMW